MKKKPRVKKAPGVAPSFQIAWLKGKKVWTSRGWRFTVEKRLGSYYLKDLKLRGREKKFKSLEEATVQAESTINTEGTW
jgi:hypothetical protein